MRIHLWLTAIITVAIVGLLSSADSAAGYTPVEAGPGFDEFDSTAVVDLVVDVDMDCVPDIPANGVVLTSPSLSPTKIEKFGQCDPDLPGPPDCGALGNDTNGSGGLEADQLPLAAPTGEAPPDGLAEIETEIVSMVLTGTTPWGGSITVTAGSDHGINPSYGAVEERPLETDFPADSFFDVFATLDVDTPMGPWHLNNFDNPARMVATINSIPPGETYTGLGPTDFKEGGCTRIRMTHLSHTPSPVGGTTELLVGGADSPASAADPSGAQSFPYVALAGAAAAAVALAASGWYARRRFLR